MLAKVVFVSKSVPFLSMSFNSITRTLSELSFFYRAFDLGLNVRFCGNWGVVAIYRLLSRGWYGSPSLEVLIPYFKEFFSRLSRELRILNLSAVSF